MARIKNTIRKNITSKIICFILISLTGILLYVGLQIYTDSMYQYYSKSFKKGQIAESDLLVNNSVDIYDEESTIKIKEENAKSVLPIFNYSVEKTLDSIERFDSFRTAVNTGNFYTVETLCGRDVSDYLKNNSNSKVISISYEILNSMLEEGFFNYDDIINAKNDGYDSITVEHSSDEFIYYLSDAIYSDYNSQSVIDSKLSKYERSGLSFSDSSVISKIVLSFVENNVIYDDLLTSQRRKEASEKTMPVYVSFEKGQVLLAKDRVITDEQLQLIALLGNSSRITLEDVLGESAFIVITMIFAVYLLCNYLNSEKIHSLQYLWIITVSLILTCLTSFFAIQKASSFGLSFVEPFIPVCFAPILITMISGKRNLGFYVSFIVGLLISATPGSTYLTFIYCTLSGVLSCLFVRLFNKRTDMVIQWLITTAITSVLTVLFVYIGAYSNHEILYSLIGNILHITVSHIIIAIILPIIEKIFNLPTIFRLNEFAYGNNPLLSKLAEAAPGTYSHSKLVSELSEAASKVIGANATLARVGGLYHDIGKTEHPEYFVENQGGTNRHEDLNPSLSVAIIKSHVKVGADKAREARLPAELIDIIANHHGNDIIAYFYNEAKKMADEDDIVASTDYSYSGSSIPETKECAIVMLADSVEAAARTVAEPTAAKFTKLINSIVYGKIERGQLDKCDLSMKEIDAVKSSFLKTLSAQYHNRIEYPDGEEEK